MLVNGKKTKSNDRIQKGDIVTIKNPYLTQEEDFDSQPKRKIIKKEDIKKIENSIVYEDDYIWAINKPNGLSVQGGLKVFISIYDILQEMNKDKKTPYIVHRLDKNTSGMLIVAKSPSVASSIAQAFKDRTIKKVYIALIHGCPNRKNGTIDIPLVKVSGNWGEKMYADYEKGMKAVTDFFVIKSNGKFSWIKLSPITGRKHQLRAHCLEIGHPIVGDMKYSSPESKEYPEKIMHLRAISISIPHPSKKPMYIKCNLPIHMQKKLFEWEWFKYQTINKAVKT